MKAIPRLALLALTAAALTLPSCESDGTFTVLGYRAGQNALYDCSIHTVHVPIFVNHTFWRGLEFDLTRAVVREIEAKTPYKVVGSDCDADSELTGEIVAFTKGTLNVNPQNEIREQQTTLTVTLVWRNLRTGAFLSDASKTPGGQAPPIVLPGAEPITSGPGILTPGLITPPNVPTDARATLAQPAAPLLGPDGRPVPPVAIVPGASPLPPGVPPSARVTVTSLGDFIPELGQSLTTAQKQNVDRMAVQIVSMMEKPW